MHVSVYLPLSRRCLLEMLDSGLNKASLLFFTRVPSQDRDGQRVWGRLLGEGERVLTVLCSGAILIHGQAICYEQVHVCRRIAFCLWIRLRKGG